MTHHCAPHAQTTGSALISARGSAAYGGERAAPGTEIAEAGLSGGAMSPGCNRAVPTGGCATIRWQTNSLEAKEVAKSSILNRFSNAT